MKKNPGPKGGRPALRPWFVFLARFMALFAVLMALYLATASYTGNVLVHTLNAGAGAKIIRFLSPRDRAVARGKAIQSESVELSISKGCEGIEAMLLLVSALAAVPMRWTYKAAGAALGILLLYVANLARIVSLFYILKHWPAAFDIAHSFVWQASIVLIAVFFFVGWTERFAAFHVSGH